MFVVHRWLLILLATCVLAQGGWRFSNPKPHGNNINDFGLNDGVVWQIGDRGSVHTSADLDHWITDETGTRQSLRGLAFFRGQAYICGEAGVILSGPSPDSLSLRALNTDDWLEDIAASADALVAVGDNGAIYHSSDGQTWARKGSFSAWMRSVAYGDGQFLAVGEDGFAATSANGQTWQERNAPNVHLNRVAFVTDRFWIVGDNGTVLTNTFRMTFNSVNVGVTNHLYAVAGNDADMILAGDLVILLGKPAGGPWIRQTEPPNPAPAPVWPYYSALWDGRLFLLGGRTGMEVEGFRTNGASPMQWFTNEQPTRNWLWSATRADDVYAAVGADGTIVTSLDGLSWTREFVPAQTGGEILLGVGGNSGALVAAGSGGIILSSPNIMTNSVSTNSNGQLQTNSVSLLGIVWNIAASPTANDLQGVAANASTFVVTGAKGTILTSGNAANWQPRVSGKITYLSGVTAWPGGFVACGDAGVILQSTDGTLWVSRNSRTTSWVYNVRFAGGKLIAVGQSGLILTSDDGVQWTQRTSGTTEWINDVIYVAGKWHAVAGAGWIITSTDSVNWIASRSITSRSLYSVASDGEQLIAVGLEGVILRNQLVVPETPINFLSYGISGPSSLFLFSGVLGQRFSLESKRTLDGIWLPERTLEFLDGNGSIIYERPNPVEASRFFRTKLLTP